MGPALAQPLLSRRREQKRVALCLGKQVAHSPCGGADPCPSSPQIPSGNLGVFGSSGAAQARTLQPPPPPGPPLNPSQPSLRAQVPQFLSPQVRPERRSAGPGGPVLRSLCREGGSGFPHPEGLRAPWLWVSQLPARPGPCQAACWGKPRSGDTATPARRREGGSWGAGSSLLHAQHTAAHPGSGCFLSANLPSSFQWIYSSRRRHIPTINREIHVSRAHAATSDVKAARPRGA